MKKSVTRLTGQTKVNYHINQILQMKSNNYNLSMRNYQFKTINPQLPKPVSMNRNYPVYTSPPPQPTINFRIQAQQPPPPINQSRVAVQQQQQPPAPSTSANTYRPSQSILNMKRQLEMLVQQTDYIEKSKNLGHTDINQSFSAARSLSNNSKLAVREPLQRTEKMKTYQKYQNYLQQPLANSNNASTFKNPQLNTLTTPSTAMSVNYENKNRSFTTFPERAEDQRKKVKNVAQLEGSSLNFKTQPAPTFSEKTINFRRPAVSPIQLKQENPETSISYDQNYYSQRHKTQGPGDRNSIQVEKKQNDQAYYSTNSRINSVPNQSKQQQSLAKSPAARPTFDTQYRPSPRIQADKTQVKQLEQNLADIKTKLKNVQVQNEKLKDSIKATSDNKDFYRAELQNQRNKIKELQEKHNSQILKLKAEFEKEKQKQRQSIRKQIEQVQKMNEVQKLKLKQNHSQDIQKLKENQGAAVQQAKKASQAQINILKQELEEKKSNVLRLIKEIKERENSVEVTQSSLQKSHDLNELYTQVAEKEHTISQLHSELSSRTKHIQMLNETFAELKGQIEELKSFKDKVQKQKYENFDQILLTQMQTINQLKDMIDNLNEKLNQTKLNLIQANRTIDSLENEIRIMEFKYKAEINKIRTHTEIEVSNKDNTISTLNKKMLTLEDKLKFAINDVKTKDEFIKQYLVGRSTSPDAKNHVEEILKKYQQSFSQTSEEKLREELAQARKQLELYEKYA